MGFLYGFAGFSCFLQNVHIFEPCSFLLSPRVTENIVSRYFSHPYFFFVLFQGHGLEIELEIKYISSKNPIFDHCHFTDWKTKLREINNLPSTIYLVCASVH